VTQELELHRPLSTSFLCCLLPLQKRPEIHLFAAKCKEQAGDVEGARADTPSCTRTWPQALWRPWCATPTWSAARYRFTLYSTGHSTVLFMALGVMWRPWCAMPTWSAARSRAIMPLMYLLKVLLLLLYCTVLYCMGSVPCTPSAPIPLP